MWVTDISYIEEWLDTLDDKTATQVIAAIKYLAERGPDLKRPFVGKIEGSKHKGMKELRPGSSGTSEIRILFIFDPERSAIMLLAGDKQGKWDKWYKKAIPEADKRYDEYLAHMGQK